MDELPTQLQAIRRADVETFARVYKAEVDVIYGYLLRRVGWDRTTAEELTQETFLSAFGSFTTGIRDHRAWLVTIAQRRLIDHIRRRSASPHTVPTGHADDIASPPGILDSVSGYPEFQVHVALSRLDADQRIALLLRYVDGLSVGEVAESMSKPVTTLYSLLARGRANLRRLYKEATRE